MRDQREWHLGLYRDGKGGEGVGLDTQGLGLHVETDGIQNSTVRASSLLRLPLITHSLPSTQLTSNIQDEVCVIFLLSM